MRKETVVIHLDLENPHVEDEKQQLLAQGFELIGERIEAKNIEAAYALHQQKHGTNDIEYPLIGALSDLPQAVALGILFGG